ncbi:MAG: PQQ-binding-like beta-propeller repeat protein [Candidatus Aureabacteria bacterium]|nr:PQQ-binding-like beta-propeller repeat protein [Candidatus Auribacterota bacterium]
MTYEIASETGKLAWSYVTGGKVTSSPSVTAGRIYFGSCDNGLYALTWDGVLKWRYASSDDIVSSPAVEYDGTVYAGAMDDNIYAIGWNGSLLWSYSSSDSVSSSPAISTYYHAGHDIVSIGSHDGALYAFIGQPAPPPTPTATPICNLPRCGSEEEESDAIKLWDMEYSAQTQPGTLFWRCLTGGPVFSSPAMSDYSYYTGSHDNIVYARSWDGWLRWSYATGDDVLSSPAIVKYGAGYGAVDGAVCVGSNDNNFYALGASDGALIWSYLTGDDVVSSPALYGPAVRFGSCDNNVYALNSTGSLEWSYAAGNDISSSPAMDRTGKAYVGSCDNNVYAIASSGALQWSYRTEGDVASSPSIDSYGRVYAGSDDNAVYAFVEPDTPTPIPTPTQTPTPLLDIKMSNNIPRVGEAFAIEVSVQPLLTPCDAYGGIMAASDFYSFVPGNTRSLRKGVHRLARAPHGIGKAQTKTLFSIPSIPDVIPSGDGELDFHVIVGLVPLGVIPRGIGSCISGYEDVDLGIIMR